MRFNRVLAEQPDYLLTIVKMPRGWTPNHLEDVPSGGKVLSIAVVASFAEAHDDLIRCNMIALQKNLRQWAIIQCPHKII